LLTKSDENYENFRKSFCENKNRNTPNENRCAVIEQDDKISVMIHQMITLNEKKNVITQPDDNSDQNAENIITQPDDNIQVIIQQDDITKRLWQCYHPAQL
jgi:hypothetical protein